MEEDLSKLSPNDAVSLICRDQDLKLDIIENIEIYGGSFVKSLAKCALTADRDNLRILVEAFLKYFIDYQPKNWPKKEGED